MANKSWISNGRGHEQWRALPSSVKAGSLRGPHLSCDSLPARLRLPSPERTGRPPPHYRRACQQPWPLRQRARGGGV
eukprot:scaffold1659_cov371-Prasinococcus_capsulatus_cf.AAC.6